MAIETEVKYVNPDLERCRRMLRRGQGEFLGRRFEQNIVFDHCDRLLYRTGRLLRLRRAGEGVLTLKRPPAGPVSDEFKVFEEIETRVSDFDSARSILLGLGFTESFRYEKFREEWRFGQAHVCLDNLPFGDFLEIEGEPSAIRECARVLELDPDSASKATYLELNRSYRKKQGLEPNDSFVFTPEQRGELSAALDCDLS